MTTDSLAIIGGGHMARALLGGLLQRGWPPASLRVADPSVQARDYLGKRFAGVAVFEDNATAAAGAPVWLLAVKPQQMRPACRSLAGAATQARPLVISVAAGIPTDSIAGWLDGAATVVRSMPNRPALIGCGITALFARPDVDAAGRERAAAVMSAVGEHVWLEDESLMDAVTAVSGSGPAYVFLLIEMLESAARAEGLDATTARQLALATVAGAARMAHEGDEEPAVMREQVTSPGGTTAAALSVLEAGDFRDVFRRAIHAATLRSRELARDFGDET